MIALDLQWKVTHPANPPAGDGMSLGLYYGDELIAEAQATWQFLVRFDVTLWASEGCYQAHMDLTDPIRQTLAWQYGATKTLAMWLLTAEGDFTCHGVVKTDEGIDLAWDPTHDFGYEYALRAPGLDPMITIDASYEMSVGGKPGFMNMGVTAAGNLGLPALVTLALAIANEQPRLLHRPPQRYR